MEKQEQLDKLIRLILKNVKTGNWIMWKKDYDGVYLDEWEIGLVTDIDFKDFNISVKHHNMHCFNFKSYLLNNAVKLIDSYWPTDKIADWNN